MPEPWTCTGCGHLNAAETTESAFATDKDFREQIADMQRVAQVTLGHCGACGAPRSARSPRPEAGVGRRGPIAGSLVILSLNAALVAVTVWPGLGGALGERISEQLTVVVALWVLLDVLGLLWWWRSVRRGHRVDQGRAPGPPPQPEPPTQPQPPRSHPRPRWG